MKKDLKDAIEIVLNDENGLVNLCKEMQNQNKSFIFCIDDEVGIRGSMGGKGIKILILFKSLVNRLNSNFPSLYAALMLYMIKTHNDVQEKDIL